MSSMMMERTGMGMPGVGVPGMGAPAVGTQGAPAAGNWLMVPRCTVKVEKCQGGLKVTCGCDDAMARSMVQNLCTMLAGGMCSCCVMLNGMTVCTYHFTMGLCRCEMTPSGVTLTCTSGDQKCCEMLQACCDCLNTMMSAGCTCCVLLNNTPVGCGCGESSSARAQAPPQRCPARRRPGRAGQPLPPSGAVSFPADGARAALSPPRRPGRPPAPESARL